MPLVGIALLFYPLFCLCGQHPREQGGAFGRETHWHVGDCLTPPRNALLRQFQTVAQWGGTHARRQKNVTSEIEVVDLLSRTTSRKIRKIMNKSYFTLIFCKFSLESLLPKKN